MRPILVLSVGVEDDVREQVIIPSTKYKERSERILVSIENSGPGTATVKIAQSYFGVYYDDDAAGVTTVIVPVAQERCAVIDVSIRAWYRISTTSVNGYANLRIALAGSRFLGAVATF